MPDRKPSNISFRERLFSSARWRISAGGARKRLASKRRDAAITSDGASSWAKRINTEAVETARIAMLIVTSKRNDDGFSVDKRTPLLDIGLF